MPALISLLAPRTGNPTPTPASHALSANALEIVTKAKFRQQQILSGFK